MILDKSDQLSKLRTWPIYGDLGMLVQFIKSGIVKGIWSGDKKWFWSSVLWMFKAKIETLALLSRSILRYNHGRHTTGTLMLLWAVTMVIAFNRGDAIGHVLSFVPFGTTILFFDTNWFQVQELLWYKASSQAVTIWLSVFTLVHIIHVLRIYLEVGNTSDHMKRGTSWLCSEILKSRYLSEFKIQCFIEPILVALVGYAIGAIYDDMLFFVLATASAICLFLQEFADGSYRYYHSRY